MNVGILTVLTTTALFAADEQRLALVLRAQTDYERVALAPAPQLHDTNVCIQSQAAMIPVATPEEAPIFHFRKGYCTLAASTITNELNGYLQAAWAFDQASAAWTGRNALLLKKRPAEPLPSVLPVLASSARLKAGKGDAKAIEAAVSSPVCSEALTTQQTCESILLAGREWVGWSSLLRDDIFAAARQFPSTSTGWTNWVAAKRAFEDRKFPDAAAAYRRAIDAREGRSKSTTVPFRERLGPPFDLSVAYTEMGGAQLLAKDASGALASLNLAVKRDSTNARALYLRGRARDAAGQSEAAIADYSLAARNALAKAGDGASGEAHVYRGISFYRRKDFARAEEEFNNALNFEITPSMRSDAIAWRRLSAVAAGSCEVGRKYLEEAMPAASPFFPREEARATISSCTATAAQRGAPAR
jgi:tetratricopeptide (TPR) repeat protein